MSRVVITGASGFVGKNLVNYFLSKKVDVIGVTRHNLPNMYQVGSYLECPDGDILIHLAEVSDRAKVNQLGKAYQAEITKLTTSLSNRFERVIYVSSGVVYGDENFTPNDETTTTKSVDLYSEIKLQNENTVLDNGGTALRLSNIYGLGMSKNNVLSDILKQIPGRGAVELRDIKPVRDFLFINDLMHAFESVLNLPHHGVLNIGSGIGLSIYELTRVVLSLYGEVNREIVSTKPSTSNSTNILDISKIHTLIGWEPSSDIRQNLRDMTSRRRK